uniref:cellulose 1,4-beta-cellobiosidase (non-reducing end) n=1 Tax=uncultured symbiotic protist of Mastotermes darwiniensis TaxID=403661 RepID=A4UX14_9EUKA|nr:putative glycosyl hydrolase family7 [uncultured symbiotic protist of Mastotermes darwiniensis]
MIVALIALVTGATLVETKPVVKWQKCTKSGCTTVTGSVTTDFESRGEKKSDHTAAVDYVQQLGVESTGDMLSQKLVTIYNGKKNVGSRLYLLDPTGEKYQMFYLVNHEFTYTVDLSECPCGMNAAIYTSEMAAEGAGLGPKFGQGYCDANYVGVDERGCAEFDIMEANTRAITFTTHPCSKLKQNVKNTVQCMPDGCGFNAYRYGGRTFYGPGATYKVDSTKKITVVTQFISSDGTDKGDLVEIRRLYVQGGKVIPNAKVSVYNSGEFDSISDKFCRTAGHQIDGYHALSFMGQSFKNGHALIFSLWDANDGMTWLDAGEYGPCPGSPAETGAAIEAAHPNLRVYWSGIKYGDLDSTY